MMKLKKKGFRDKNVTPEDLGVVVATKEEALWQKVKEQAKAEIQACENGLAIQKELLRIAEEKTKNLKLTSDQE